MNSVKPLALSGGIIVSLKNLRGIHGEKVKT